jgi:hypothetical protein
MSEVQKTPGRGLPPGTPRWLKLFVTIFIVIVVLLVILHLMGFGFGGHGLGNHGGIPVPGPVDYSWLAGYIVEQL